MKLVFLQVGGPYLCAGEVLGADVERFWKTKLLKQWVLFWDHKWGCKSGSTLNQSFSKRLVLVCQLHLGLVSAVLVKGGFQEPYK